MRDPHAPRTGVLECEKGSASFYVDDFCFSIMNNVMKKITNRFGETYNAANFLFTLKNRVIFLLVLQMTVIQSLFTQKTVLIITQLRNVLSEHRPM